MPEIAVEQEVQEVTFYSWMGTDATGRQMPSSQVIHISGGNSQLSADGQKIMNPVVEAAFHNGVFRTADPMIIKELRRIAAKSGSCLTEDRERFYGATLTKDQQVHRAAIRNEQITKENESLVEENNKMRRMLEEQSKAAHRRPSAAQAE